MNPSKRDRWPEPTRWAHCWVRFGPALQPPPAPGLILDWRREGAKWKAWVTWRDNSGFEGTIKQAWLRASVLRPAKSDRNIWNDGPWR